MSGRGSGIFKVLLPVRHFFLRVDPRSPPLARTMYGSGVIFARLLFFIFLLLEYFPAVFVISQKGSVYGQ